MRRVYFNDKEVKDVSYKVVKGDNNTPRVKIDGFYTPEKYQQWYCKNEKQPKIILVKLLKQ